MDLLARKKAPAGWFHSKTKVVNTNHIPDHSRPNSDQIISENMYVCSKFIENRGFSIKIAKTIKIVAKNKLRIPAVLNAIDACFIFASVSWKTLP